MYKCKYREAQEFLKWMSSVERMSSAGGRLGTAPALLTAQTLAAAGHNRGPGRAHLSFDGVGLFWRIPRLANCSENANVLP